MKRRRLDKKIIAKRAQAAWEMADPCRLCPRHCGVRRRENKKGVCGTGRAAKVSSYFPHHGEERCLRGTRGSGTIFFAGCNLGCIFCQNYELSQLGEGRETAPEELAAAMMYLQEAGCHNLNLVTPTHVVPHILDALVVAVEAGFTLPIVYNSGGYDAVETLTLLEGIVDIYMPDFKYWDPVAAEQLSGAGDYPMTARQAVKEMHRQTGDLVLDDHGIAVRGLLVRHLVLPNGMAGTRDIMRFLADEISSDTFVNVMGQYHPCWRARTVAEINRPVRIEEIIRARQEALAAGLRRFAD
ncbi:MAG TPA: radical SAM protein [bacterium]|nr:radical SAM protein [Candidatus Omnitrophota bacterium]HOL93767.1 radical SAM protein [bacterium]